MALESFTTAALEYPHRSFLPQVIKSLLLRLGKLMTATKLYRGLNGLAPPPGFWQVIIMFSCCCGDLGLEVKRKGVGVKG